jgi:putative addiction module killer protein
MLQVIRTERYASWARSLRDDRAAARIAIRIDRLAIGNAGDVKSVGGGVGEMRIDYGPGYRIYFARHGSKLIVLLCGGTKKSQPADIAEAKAIFANWKAENDQDKRI